MVFDVRNTDLARLNSITKYPSIPTYHTLDPKNGRLLEETARFDGEVIGTEKIDGTNARVICLPDGGYILGSREELLYGRGDLIGNPALGIVEALKGFAEDLVAEDGHGMDPDGVTVLYLEVFGGKVTAASRQYTGSHQVSFRLFDAMWLRDYGPLLAREPQSIAAWRDSGGQPFVDEESLQKISELASVPLTPRLFSIDAEDLPRSVADMQAFLEAKLPASQSALDGGAGGRAEGIVLRTPSRSSIAKARFEDYRRTLRNGGDKRGGGGSQG